MSKILAVDDDPAILTAIENALLQAGHEPITTAQPEEVLGMLGEQPVDALILDLRMPEISGFELLRNLRSDPRWRMLPVLMLSADGSSESRVKGLRSGADDYLVKPFIDDELVARLERMTRRQNSDTGLQGSLERFPVQDLLPYLENGNKTGLLELANRTRAFEIFFQEGRIVDAVAGRLSGRDALLEAITLTDGFFHFQIGQQLMGQQQTDKDSSAPLKVGLQGVLLEAAWLEDEIAARRDSLPSNDLPLQVVGIPTPFADFEDLPIAETVAWFTERPGRTLQELLDGEVAASHRILLSVALLFQRRDLVKAEVMPPPMPMPPPPMQASGMPSPKAAPESAPLQEEDAALTVRLARLLRLFARRGYDHRQGHLQIFFQRSAWESLLELLATLPDDLLYDSERLFAQLREHGRGAVRLPLDAGSLLLHLQPLDAKKPPKPALFEISGASILWLADDTWGVAHETCIGFIEHARKNPSGYVVLTGSETGAIAKALQVTKRWTKIERPKKFNEIVTILIEKVS